MKKTKKINKLGKEIVDYYFNNPPANSTKEMEEKFNVSHSRIRRVLSQELKQRAENSLLKKCINLYEK